MRLAARCGEIWVTTGDRLQPGPIDAKTGAAMLRRQVEQLEGECARLGRDPASLRRLVVCGPQLDQGLASPDAFRETAGRHAEIGVTDLVVPWPRAEPPYAADLAVFERIFAEIRVVH